MTIHFSLSFLLGVVITSTLSSLIKTNSENTGYFIPPDQYSYSHPSVESMVDSRFKLLAVDFQDQIDNLKGKVGRLEASKTVTDDRHHHGIQKRQANSSNSIRKVCENSSSFCTYFHPDHPDAGRSRGNHTPTVPNEMMQKPAKQMNGTTTSDYSTSATATNEIVHDASTRVEGIPTSCKDLLLLGHKLNGVYLIKTSRRDQGVKVEAVYCEFKSSSAAVQEISKSVVIGSVKTTTKNIFFYAQRNSPFSLSNAAIPWELERLNEGGAFNLTSGVFTAPVPGIYHFEFHGVKDVAASYLDILLQLNGNTFASATTGVTGTTDNLSLGATLRLKANDRVNMFIWKNALPFPSGVLYDIGHLHVTHFSGWLLEEDLV